MKSCIAPKTNIIDVYVTGVPEIAIAIVISRLTAIRVLARSKHSQPVGFVL